MRRTTITAEKYSFQQTIYNYVYDGQGDAKSIIEMQSLLINTGNPETLLIYFLDGMIRTIDLKQFQARYRELALTVLTNPTLEIKKQYCSKNNTTEIYHAIDFAITLSDINLIQKIIFVAHRQGELDIIKRQLKKYSMTSTSRKKNLLISILDFMEKLENPTPQTQAFKFRLFTASLTQTLGIEKTTYSCDPNLASLRFDHSFRNTNGEREQSIIEICGRSEHWIRYDNTVSNSTHSKVLTHKEYELYFLIYVKEDTSDGRSFNYALRLYQDNTILCEFGHAPTVKTHAAIILRNNLEKITAELDISFTENYLKKTEHRADSDSVKHANDERKNLN